MTKRTKATAALACGAALLLGAGTTYAMWNLSAPLGAGDTLATGALRLDWSVASNPVAWYLNDVRIPTATVAAGGFQMAPADSLVARTSVDATLRGTNLVASLTSDASDLVDLDWLHTEVTVGGAARLDGLHGTQTVPVTVTVRLPDVLPDGVTYEGFTVRSLTLHLTQQR